MVVYNLIFEYVKSDQDNLFPGLLLFGRIPPLSKKRSLNSPVWFKRIGLAHIISAFLTPIHTSIFSFDTSLCDAEIP